MKSLRQNFKIGNSLGRLGEDIAARYLEIKGFVILTRNYRKKWGEIDIVARFRSCTHFIEVKAVSREMHQEVSRETDKYRPEDNIHPFKLRRLSRTIQSYLLENHMSDSSDWHFDVVTVIIDPMTKKAGVKMINNVVLA